jgi:hypothetical protein
MEGSKTFQASKDFPEQSSASGKPMLERDRAEVRRFLDLQDTFQDYGGKAGEVIVINDTEDGLTHEDLSEFVGDLETIQADVTTLKGDDATTKEDVATLKGDVATVQGDISTLQEGLGTAATNIDTLQGDVSDLQENADNLYSLLVISADKKPFLDREYTLLAGEKTGYDALATTYGITTEKTNYDNAVNDLVSYVGALDPALSDYANATPDASGLLLTKFYTVYSTRSILLRKLLELASTNDISGAAGSIKTTDFTIMQESGKLVFKFGTTVIASMSNAGKIIANDEVEGFGTP